MEQVDYLKGYDLRYLASLLHSRCESFADVGPTECFKDYRTDTDLSVNLTEFLRSYDLDPAMFTHAKNKTTPDTARDMLPDLIKITDEQWGEGLYPRWKSTPPTRA